MCYFHVVENNEKFHQVLTKNGICGHLKADINVLQHSVDKSFKKAKELFLSKWKAHRDLRVKEFMSHFEEQWLLKYLNWYEGAVTGYPLTNNSPEGANVKDCLLANLLIVLSTWYGLGLSVETHLQRTLNAAL